jgi:Carboxylesterase family
MNHRTNRWRFAALALPILAAVALFSAAPPAAHAQQNPIAFTLNGPVQGTVSPAGIHEFLGIPYAAPPVGDLRWQPPFHHSPWLQDIEIRRAETRRGIRRLRRESSKILRQRPDSWPLTS